MYGKLLIMELVTLVAPLIDNDLLRWSIELKSSYIIFMPAQDTVSQTWQSRSDRNQLQWADVWDTAKGARFVPLNLSNAEQEYPKACWQSYM
jgi:hypothetical protein